MWFSPACLLLSVKKYLHIAVDYACCYYPDTGVDTSN
jgi:hypothetical protein